MLYSEIIAVCSQIHTKHINTLCGQNVPRSKHTVSVIKSSQLMLYCEIIAVCSQIHTKHINTLCGQNVPRSEHAPSRLL
jgi:Leu/Phe-tRNA-protein transferase